MVRARRYFYSNTHLDGHSFDYLAKPKSANRLSDCSDLFRHLPIGGTFQSAIHLSGDSGLRLSGSLDDL